MMFEDDKYYGVYLRREDNNNGMEEKYVLTDGEVVKRLYNAQFDEYKGVYTADFERFDNLKQKMDFVRMGGNIYDFMDRERAEELLKEWKSKKGNVFYAGIKDGEFKLVERNSFLSQEDIVKEGIFDWTEKNAVALCVFCGEGSYNKEKALGEGVEAFYYLGLNGFIDGNKVKKYTEEAINLLKEGEILPLACYGVYETNEEIKDVFGGDTEEIWRINFQDEEVESVSKLERRKELGKVEYLLRETRRGEDQGFKNSVYVFGNNFNFNSAINFMEQYKKDKEKRRKEQFDGNLSVEGKKSGRGR